jgi:hypothetical protein
MINSVPRQPKAWVAAATQNGRFTEATYITNLLI